MDSKEVAKPREPHDGFVVATSTPDLFMQVLKSKLDNGVWIVDNSQAVFERLRQLAKPVLVADFAELPADRWSGQRFVRTIKADKKLHKVPVYLMAEHWPEVQASWSRKMGAAGLLQRSATAVGAFILGRTPRLSSSLRRTLTVIDEAFRVHAGPLAASHIEDARTAIEAREIDMTPAAYAQFLADRFATERMHDEFIRHVTPFLGKEWSGQVSSVGDPWLDRVNEVFATYAGGLASRLGVMRTLAAVEKHGLINQSAYLEGLSDTIIDPRRRTEFIQACKANGLA